MICFAVEIPTMYSGFKTISYYRKLLLSGLHSVYLSENVHQRKLTQLKCRKLLLIYKIFICRLNSVIVIMAQISLMKSLYLFSRKTLTKLSIKVSWANVIQNSSAFG
uniref:Uncharacterized protein n=1 Tax=Pararge aegeria TaxID=116150 RepID=S4P0A8_9NEOP